MNLYVQGAQGDHVMVEKKERAQVCHINFLPCPGIVQHDDVRCLGQMLFRCGCLSAWLCSRLKFMQHFTKQHKFKSRITIAQGNAGISDVEQREGTDKTSFSV